MTENLLTVLIPAYNSLDGVVRIIETVKLRGNIGVIVSDDSTDSAVANAIEAYIVGLNRSDFVYVKHQTVGVAIDNWNALLAMVNTKFFCLIHHDEFFSNSLFVDELESYQNDIDIMVLPLSVKDGQEITRNVPSWMQRILISIFSSRGPVLNFIGGPCGLLIIKTGKMVYFNRDLKWYVDCEWYRRIFAQVRKNKIYYYPHTVTNSIYCDDSITQEIRPFLKTIARNEINMMAALDPYNVSLNNKFIGACYNIMFKTIQLPSFLPYYFRKLVRRFICSSSI